MALGVLISLGLAAKVTAIAIAAKIIKRKKTATKPEKKLEKQACKQKKPS